MHQVTLAADLADVNRFFDYYSLCTRADVHCARTRNFKRSTPLGKLDLRNTLCIRLSFSKD